MDQCICQKVSWSIYFILCYRDKSKYIFGLSQKTINKILKGFRMNNCFLSTIPIIKGDKFNSNQYTTNELEREQMKNIQYII